MAEQLDPVLDKAIDDYVERLRTGMKLRALKGEREYHGVWKQKTPDELLIMIGEEQADIHVYNAMLGARIEMDRSGLEPREW